MLSLTADSFLCLLTASVTTPSRPSADPGRIPSIVWVLPNFYLDYSLPAAPRHTLEKNLRNVGSVLMTLP
jgi:hypothetical protein